MCDSRVWAQCSEVSSGGTGGMAWTIHLNCQIDEFTTQLGVRNAGDGREDPPRHDGPNESYACRKEDGASER